MTATRKKVHEKQHPGRGVVYKGKTYPSMKSLARTLNKRSRHVKKMIEAGEAKWAPKGGK